VKRRALLAIALLALVSIGEGATRPPVPSRRPVPKRSTSRKPKKRSPMPPRKPPNAARPNSKPSNPPEPSVPEPPMKLAPTEARGLLPATDELLPLFEWNGEERFANNARELEEVFGAEAPFQRSKQVTAAARREFKSAFGGLKVTIVTYDAPRDALAAFVELPAAAPGVTREVPGGGMAYHAPPESGVVALLWKGAFVVTVASTVRFAEWEAVRDALFKAMAARIPDAFGAVQVMVNGQELPFDGDLFQTSDSVLAPLKPVLDHLGYTLKLNPRTGELEATDGKRSLRLKLKSRLVTVREADGSPRTTELTLAPFLFNNLVYVPLDCFRSALGLAAEWDADRRKLTLTAAGG